MPRHVALSAQGVQETVLEAWRVVESATVGLDDEDQRMAFIAAALANMLAVMAEQTGVDIAATLNATFARAGLPHRVVSAS
jgi:hypothetical protein